MSLADHIRLLRARQGGIGYDALKERVNIEAVKHIFQIERKQRDIVDDATLEQLASAFSVPIEELRQAQAHTRKALAGFCLDAHASGQTVNLHLRHGEILTGQIQWLDMAAIGLQSDGPNTVVVQRHAVTHWELSST